MAMIIAPVRTEQQQHRVHLDENMVSFVVALSRISHWTDKTPESFCKSDAKLVGLQKCYISSFADIKIFSYLINTEV